MPSARAITFRGMRAASGFNTCAPAVGVGPAPNIAVAFGITDGASALDPRHPRRIEFARDPKDISAGGAGTLLPHRQQEPRS